MQLLKNIKWDFWIGNAVMIFSTVLGVYLAAKAGLTTALEFENLREDRDKYNLRRSLYAEMDHNAAALEQVAHMLDKGMPYHPEVPGSPHVRTYVMKQ